MSLWGPVIFKPTQIPLDNWEMTLCAACHCISHWNETGIEPFHVFYQKVCSLRNKRTVLSNLPSYGMVPASLFYGELEQRQLVIPKFTVVPLVKCTSLFLRFIVFVLLLILPPTLPLLLSLYSGRICATKVHWVPFPSEFLFELNLS